MTLLEVMLALAVIAVAMMAGLEMMARVVASQNGGSRWSAWERKLRAARDTVNETSAPEVEAKVANGGVWQMPEASVRASAEKVPYPDTAIPLLVRLEDAAGEKLAEVGMLKVKEGE